MKNILIIAHFSDDFDFTGNNRFNYLAEMLTSLDYKVTLLTSSFSHAKKTQRMNKDINLGYSIVPIFEPGYKKNVSVKRILSHQVFNHRLQQSLRSIEKPDIIYCAVPTFKAAKTSIKYAKKNKIKCVIDIQDLWPEAFQMVTSNSFVKFLIFNPLKRNSEWVYKNAHGIVSVSETYLERALKLRTDKNGVAVFLGTDLTKFDTYSSAPSSFKKAPEEFWIGYAGTLGHSYDLTSVIDSLQKITQMSTQRVKLIVMGDGPLMSHFVSYSKEQNVNVLFTGRLKYKEMCSVLKMCNVAINPISKGAAQSIINKHADYAAAGIPVINTQECVEYRNLVCDYKMGLNCENNNSDDIAEKIVQLINNPETLKIMGLNSRKLAEEKFDRNTTYKKIITYLETLDYD